MVRNIKVTPTDNGGWHTTFEYRTWNLGWTLGADGCYRTEAECKNLIDECAKDALLFSLESISWNAVDKINSPDSIPHKALSRLNDGIKYLHDDKCGLVTIKEIIVKLEAHLSIVVKESSVDLSGDEIKLGEMLNYCKTL